ncbi:MAG: PqqD family protein [Bauldia sp.]|uniref:PqqD family protein n=1 Tax=Bauldia sp. TaxID=2575872 RepID=UPI001D63D9A1|nr:PqqD family protein [Bauldia sp.]MCB1496069.1 PqqD family protein [Bauldia sp.]
MSVVTGATIFEAAKWVVIRPQKGDYLFYNSHTDELHLIPPTGHAVFSRCDGIKTIDEITEDLAPSFKAQPDEVRGRLLQFLGELETRGLLERTHG